ncbi:MAG TPA: hypothetical protein VKC66_07210 [Xanthobacteraceae bacterium]|nr:hypothetical protein [Xanthobacteraceae bacterium]
MRKHFKHSGQWIAAALFAAGFALVFRSWLFSGFDAAFGDDEDGYLALALIEHWRHVFSGAVHWTDPIFFFPHHGVLGYTDAFFLFGVVHAPLRLAGVDPFTALMLVMAGFSAIGFFGFRRLAARHFAIPPAYAAVGAFLFAFANMDAVKLIHIQAYGAMLLPSLCDLVLSGWNSKRRGAVLGGAAGLLYSALFLTAFQTAWFFGFFLLLLVLLHPAICGQEKSRDLVREMMTSRRSLIVAAVVAFAAGIVPFLILYLPVFLAGHSRDFAEVASNMPEWSDLANVTPENAVWGNALQRLGVTGQADDPVWEAELGFTPAVLAVFILGFALLVMQMRHPPGPRGSAALPSAACARGLARRAGGDDRVVVLLGAAVIILWLLQMDYFGVRLWRAIWAAVPGAQAIRYTFRSQLVANLFVAIVVARVLAACASARVWTRLLCAVLIVEQVNLAWPAVMSRRVALAWIDVPPPPEGCRIFYVSPHAGPPDRTGPQHQDDAMLLAEIRGIPTVNGYSSWFPSGWALDDPANPDYAGAVRSWADRNGIAQGLCGLEPRAGTWTPGPPQ